MVERGSAWPRELLTCADYMPSSKQKAPFRQNPLHHILCQQLKAVNMEPFSHQDKLKANMLQANSAKVDKPQLRKQQHRHAGTPSAAARVDKVAIHNGKDKDKDNIELSPGMFPAVVSYLSATNIPSCHPSEFELRLRRAPYVPGQ